MNTCKGINSNYFSNQDLKKKLKNRFLIKFCQKLINLKILNIFCDSYKIFITNLNCS